MGCLASKAAARPERGGEGECSECCCAETEQRGPGWYQWFFMLGISWEFSSGLEGSGTAASVVSSDH